MKVIATRLGNYNNRRIRPGVKFLLASKKDFSSKWMKEAKKVLKEEDMPGEDELRAQRADDIAAAAKSARDVVESDDVI